jgi:hypothetical protein
MFRRQLLLFALFGFAGASHAGVEASFEHKVHDFGATPRGPLLVHYFRFTNSGKETLTISNVRVSCGCVTASAPVNTVKPGESSYITAQMDSRRFSGAKSVTVFVQFSTPVFEEVSLVVQANGRDDFTMTPDSIAFGNIRRGSDPKGSVQVTLIGDPKWEIREANADSNYVKPAFKEVKRNGAEVTYEISATLRPDLPMGKWYTDIWLVTTNPNLAKVRVPLQVDVSAPVTVTPAALSLGEIKIGDDVEQNVLVKGDKPFKITSIKGADGVVTVKEAAAEAKAIHIITVKVKPSETGDIVKELTVVTDEADNTTVSIPVRAKAVKK